MDLCVEGFFNAEIKGKHFMCTSVDTYIMRKHKKFRLLFFFPNMLNNSYIYSGEEKAVTKMFKYLCTYILPSFFLEVSGKYHISKL